MQQNGLLMNGIYSYLSDANLEGLKNELTQGAVKKINTMLEDLLKNTTKSKFRIVNINIRGNNNYHVDSVEMVTAMPFRQSRNFPPPHLKEKKEKVSVNISVNAELYD
jgi:predicted secreted protein